MFELDGFIPKILLCGDREEFFSEIGERPCEVLGQIEFFGEFDGKSLDFAQDKKFWLNGEFYEIDYLPKILKEIAYVVFTDFDTFSYVLDFIYDDVSIFSKFLTLREFKSLPANNFYGIQADRCLINILKKKQWKYLLDANGYFVKSQMITKIRNNFSEIDGIFDGDLPLIKENIYSHVYKNFSDCQFKHYDCVLFNVHSAKRFRQNFLHF